MKQLIPALLFVIALSSSAKDSPAKRVPVADAATAVAIARPAAIKVYGRSQIANEEPLTASLADGVWSVYGTLCCPDRKGKRSCVAGACVGGVVKVEIRQSDGKVLSITHTK